MVTLLINVSLSKVNDDFCFKIVGLDDVFNGPLSEILWRHRPANIWPQQTFISKHFTIVYELLDCFVEEQSYLKLWGNK